MRLTKRSAIAARARRREILAEAGMSAEALERWGLPTREAAVAELDRLDDEDTGPTSWVRPV
ncbi:hypothetical protein [Nocardia sp. NPDC050406]|uniref:hypothetical protein n=1 Tax=Nocardia sp. NPDC050406 TaxID=3364318 RepID=UPI00379AF676